MKNIIFNLLYKTVLLLAFVSLISCEDFLDVDYPIDQISDELVFENEGTATAAVTSLYADLRDNTQLSNNSIGIGIAMGLYADEFDYYGIPGMPLDNFYNHLVLPSNTQVSSYWNSTYKLIYNCNLSIEKLNNSSSLDNELVNQLMGEAIFIRSLAHFYLLQIFGKIPYIKTTDYQINKTVERIEEQTVYEYLIDDLKEAKLLISENYVSGERTRANKYVISSLLSRVYLYSGDYMNAVVESSLVIDNSVNYYLEEDLNEEFRRSSGSAILQLKPANEGQNSYEGSYFLFQSGPPINVALRHSYLLTFEPTDLRRLYWIKEVSDGVNTWYAPNKYKLQEPTSLSEEYSIVLRLAEQYLIRAEARAHLGLIPDSLLDINTLRSRAGLNTLTALSQADLLMQIILERKHELFSEFGHRWFDLKRFSLANEVLAPIKVYWKPTHILLPIPENELLINPNLSPQNPGYN
jgi:hypothetical protein